MENNIKLLGHYLGMDDETIYLNPDNLPYRLMITGEEYMSLAYGMPLDEMLESRKHRFIKTLENMDLPIEQIAKNFAYTVVKQQPINLPCGDKHAFNLYLLCGIRWIKPYYKGKFYHNHSVTVTGSYEHHYRKLDTGKR